MKSALIASVAAVALGGCAITQNVKPVAATGITDLCVKNNPQVMMDGFVKELRGQIEKKGIRTTQFDGERPASCRYHLEYTANWRWDMAMYLVFAQVSVYDGGLMVGQATYDAHGGGLRPDKWGPTSDKLAGLLNELIKR